LVVTKRTNVISVASVRVKADVNKFEDQEIQIRKIKMRKEDAYDQIIQLGKSGKFRRGYR
jgi:hypothetical protein